MVKVVHEMEEDHNQTLDMMEYCKYDMSYMFFYSERPGTLAQKRFKDDVPEEIKKRRLQEVVEIQNKINELNWTTGHTEIYRELQKKNNTIEPEYNTYISSFHKDNERDKDNGISIINSYTNKNNISTPRIKQSEISPTKFKISSESNLKKINNRAELEEKIQEFRKSKIFSLRSVLMASITNP